MIKTDSRESMTDQQRWVMDNLLGSSTVAAFIDIARII